MSTLLADTSFFVAYLNAQEDCHAMAVDWMTASSERIVTTEWVLAELGNYLAEGANRRLFGSLVRALSVEERVEIVAADTMLEGGRLSAERTSCNAQGRIHAWPMERSCPSAFQGRTFPGPRA